MSTIPLIKKALAEGKLSTQLYTDYFGPAPFKRLAMTQHAGFNFGRFKMQEAKMQKQEYLVQSYANEEPPDNMKSLLSRVDTFVDTQRQRNFSLAHFTSHGVGLGQAGSTFFYTFCDDPRSRFQGSLRSARKSLEMIYRRL